MLTAFGPFGDSPISKVTLSPSFKSSNSTQAKSFL
jgi:hypothetical protein